MKLDRITTLSCGQTEIVLEELEGGITNRNYLARDGSTNYVVRTCEDRRFLGIDRTNESVCQQAAHRAGVAPAIVHREEGILVSQYVHAKTLCDDDLHDTATLERLAATLRQLHQSRDQLQGEMLFFCPFQTVRTYAATARRLQATLPMNIDELVEDSRRLSREIADYQPTLCHNDILAPTFSAMAARYGWSTGNTPESATRCLTWPALSLTVD